MNQITCDYCGNVLSFAELNQRPEICSDCNSSLNDLEVVNSGDEVSNESQTEEVTPIATSPGGLTLIHPATGGKIEVPHADQIILGRTNVGGELLANLPHISREHCRIEYDGSKYLISDLGSTNGTYIGESKIDCATNPGQELEDGAALYLGREEFLIRLNPAPMVEPVNEQPEVESVSYRCSQCGVEFETRDEICPGCGSYDSMERV